MNLNTLDFGPARIDDVHRARFRRCKVRQPFTIERLRWLCRLYQIPFRKPGSLYRRFAFSLPILALFKMRQLVPLPLLGQFIFRRESAERRVGFNALNTQFSALYLAPYEQRYEAELGPFMDAVLDEDATFVDMGSNWGYFSIWVASKPGFRGRVLAFEPVPATFADLQKTVEGCGLRDQIECDNAGLSEFNGRSSMILPDLVQSGAATLHRSQRVRHIRGISVQLRTLDSLELTRLDLIKVDVEGHEAQVFAGGMRTLGRTKPIVVFENGRNLSDWKQSLRPLEVLEELGYMLFQPCWVGESSGRRCFFWPDEGCQTAAPERLLGLVPVTVDKRLLHDGTNLVACHPEKMELLDEKFEMV